MLDNIDLKGASGVLVNITSGSDLTTDEFEIIGNKIKDIANKDAKIITGCIKEEDNIGDLRVTIIATGFVQDTATVDVAETMTTSQYTNLPDSDSSSDINEVVQTTAPNVAQQEEQTSIDIPAFLRQQAD